MASPNISKKEVREKLEEAVKSFDYLKEFFPYLDKLISRYQVLYTQLRKGDELDIKISKTEPTKHSFFRAEPLLKILLCSKKNEPTVVCTLSYDGIIRGIESLYKD